MPVNIYRITPGEEKNEHLAWLCDSEWRMQPQIETLSSWLEQHASALKPDEYVADVGFCWRRDASGGGPVLEPSMMERMVKLGMCLNLSEYGFFADEHEKAAGT